MGLRLESHGQNRAVVSERVDEEVFTGLMEEAAKEALRKGYAQGKRDAAASLEARGSLLCDCEPEAENNTPTNIKTGAVLDHHCECRAVLAAAAVLGGYENTIHASQCHHGELFEGARLGFPGGYGRYEKDPERVFCPRGPSQTVCVVRDGNVSCADDGACASCGEQPADLLRDLVRTITETPMEGE